MQKLNVFSGAAGALVFALGLTGAAYAQTAAPRTVTCASTAVFNTGSNGGGGKLALSNVPDPSWGYAPGATVVYPPAGTTWTTPVTGRLVDPAWIWTDSDTVSPQAQWLTRDAGLAGTFVNYYRYVFNLSPTVDPAQFQVATTYYADDGVSAIYVNGRPQSPLPANSWGATPPRATVPGTATLAGDWVTGTNEVVVAVWNSGASPSGLLVNTTLANCVNSMTPAAVPTMEVWGLTSLAALVSFGAWIGLGRRTRRRA